MRREKYRKEAEKRQIEAEKQYNKAYYKALRLQYSIEDSLKVNCETGTKAFILRCGLDSTKKYRGSFLMKVATEKSKSLSIQYVKKMIEYKAKPFKILHSFFSHCFLVPFAFCEGTFLQRYKVKNIRFHDVLRFVC